MDLDEQIVRKVSRRKISVQVKLYSIGGFIAVQLYSRYICVAATSQAHFMQNPQHFLLSIHFVDIMRNTQRLAEFADKI